MDSMDTMETIPTFQSGLAKIWTVKTRMKNMDNFHYIFHGLAYAAPPITDPLIVPGSIIGWHVTFNLVY